MGTTNGLQKHLREVLDRLPGWRLDGYTGSGHARLRHDDTGALVITSSSPSCPKTQTMVLRQARKALHAAQERRR
jgi:hypothetical protein